MALAWLWNGHYTIERDVWPELSPICGNRLNHLGSQQDIPISGLSWLQLMLYGRQLSHHMFMLDWRQEHDHSIYDSPSKFNWSQVENVEAKVGRKGFIKMKGKLPMDINKRKAEPRRGSSKHNLLALDISGLEMRLRNFYTGKTALRC